MKECGVLWRESGGEVRLADGIERRGRGRRRCGLNARDARRSDYCVWTYREHQICLRRMAAAAAAAAAAASDKFCTNKQRKNASGIVVHLQTVSGTISQRQQMRRDDKRTSNDAPPSRTNASCVYLHTAFIGSRAAVQRLRGDGEGGGGVVRYARLVDTGSQAPVERRRRRRRDSDEDSR
jgi:hypothetical protein